MVKKSKSTISLELLEQILLKSGLLKCRFCNSDLEKRARYYPHANGILLKGFVERQWVYFRCSNPKCQYDWALWKLIK